MGRQSRRIKIAGRPRKRPIEHDADCFTPDMAQCRSVIPKLSITWDEGVAKPVIDLVKRMLRLYHRHADAIYVCYRMYIKAWHKQTKPLFSEHEMATYRLQTVLAARLAEAALANAVWHPCQQGVVSQLGDRSISIHLASLTRMNVRGWGMQFQPRRPPASQVGPAPLPYYSEHFLDRWRERAVGTTMEDRSYISAGGT